MDYTILYPLLGGIAHGKLHDWWIFRHYGVFYQVARMYYPENPRTAVQQSQRNNFYDAKEYWHGFDAATKNYYNELARGKPSYGYSRYLGLYLRANKNMLIYWGDLKQSSSENVTIPEYMAAHGGAGGEAFPVGSIFIATVSTNPATLLGYGTWSAFGAGKVLIGLDSGDADFNEAEETGGAKTKAISAHAGTAVAQHAAKNTGEADAGAAKRGSTTSTLTLKAHVHSISAYSHDVTQPNAHSDLNVVQPYIVVYMWKRTA